MKTALLLAVFLALTAPLLAQDPPMDPGMSCPMGGMGMGGMMGGGGMGMGGGMQGMCPMCGMMGMGGMLPGGMYLMRAQMLGLTDDQIAKIQSTQTDFRRTQIKTQSEIQLAQLDLQQELMKDKPDSAKIEQLIKRINGLQAEVQIAAMKASLAVRNVLTPAQRRMCKSMMMKMMMPQQQGGMQMPGGMQPMGPGGMAPGGMQPMGPSGGSPAPPMAH